MTTSLLVADCQALDVRPLYDQLLVITGGPLKNLARSSFKTAASNTTDVKRTADGTEKKADWACRLTDDLWETLVKSFETTHSLGDAMRFAVTARSLRISFLEHAICFAAPDPLKAIADFIGGAGSILSGSCGLRTDAYAQHGSTAALLGKA